MTCCNHDCNQGRTCPAQQAPVAELRVSLQMADRLATSGIRFVPVPVFCDHEFKKFVGVMQQQLEAAFARSEAAQAAHGAHA